MAVSKISMNRHAVFIVCLRDTSERKAADAALRDSETRYRRLFDNVVEGVYSSTHDGRILTANPALVSMVGCASAQELLSIHTASLYADPLARERIVAAAMPSLNCGAWMVRLLPCSKMAAPCAMKPAALSATKVR
jgi:PAS domain-containing protein